ncbi:MAG: NUDIX domain-containing protein [Lachnospiraceae bacterium]|nr:NUDIX domain-containing protein [Lachnospiraceae bacterium]
MKKLLVLDYKNYTEDLPVYEKNTVRAIIMKDGKLAMQQSHTGEYKILGGVVEEGESHLTTILREVEEEAGMFVKADSLREIGVVEEKRLDVFHKNRIYHCLTYFYGCDVEDGVVPLKLTDSEVAKGYKLAWATPQQIVETNRALIKEKWKLRDTEFVNLLLEGKVHD